MPEVWSPVVGWENLYEVSDCGRVRSVERVVPFGARMRRVQPRVLRPGRSTHGEVLFVHLTNGERRQVRRIHLLVLEAFRGPRPPGLDGCHWDDDHENNHLENLRWDTKSANGHDRVRNGKDVNSLKTRCPKGHEYTPENTRIGRNGGRWCRECHRIDGRARYHRDIENQRAYRREQMRRSRANRKIG